MVSSCQSFFFPTSSSSIVSSPLPLFLRRGLIERRDSPGNEIYELHNFFRCSEHINHVN